MSMYGSDRLTGGMNRERATDGRSYIHSFMQSSYDRDYKRHNLAKAVRPTPPGAMAADARMFRQESTYTEDYPRWPVGEGHTRAPEITIVEARSTRETTYGMAYVDKPLPERTPSQKPAYVPPSVGPLSSKTEHRDRYTPPHPTQFANMIPVTAQVGSGYRQYDTTYGSDFDGPVTQSKRVPCGPYPGRGSHMDMPDSRTFRTEASDSFVPQPANMPPDQFYPNPPVIPQVFVQEHLMPFRGDQHTGRVPTTMYRPTQYQP